MLKVQITPQRFLASLKAVAAFTPRPGPKPILQSVQLEAATDGRLLLRATDLDAFIALELAHHKVLEPGAVQVPRDRIRTLLAQARGTAVTIEALASDGPPTTRPSDEPTRVVVVRSARSTATLPTFDPEHFPVLPDEATTGAVALPAWRLVQLIERTQFAADPVATRYALGGPVFEFGDGVLDVVATDGRCLAHAFAPARGTALRPIAERPAGDAAESLAPAVSAHALNALAGVLRDLEMTVELGFTVTGRLLVQGKGLTFSARQLPGRFPPWRNHTQGPSSTSFRVDDPAAFQRALKETSRLLPPGQTGMGLRLHRHVLTLAVENVAVSTTREIAVRNLSEDIESEAVIVIDPASLLPYLAAQHGPFVFAFPPAPGQPACCLCDGWQCLVVPLGQDEPTSPAAVATDGAAHDHEHDQEPSEPPTSEALSAQPVPDKETTMTKPRSDRTETDGPPAQPPAPKDKPARVIRIRNLRANIWANRLASGAVIYNVTFDRLWKEDDETDGNGGVIKKGEWHQSPSFGKDDLLLLAKLADLAHTWVYRKVQDESRDQSF